MTTDAPGHDRDGQGEESSSTEPEGTIPNTEDGVGATTTDEPSSFEPEEDADDD